MHKNIQKLVFQPESRMNSFEDCRKAICFLQRFSEGTAIVTQHLLLYREAARTPVWVQSRSPLGVNAADAAGRAIIPKPLTSRYLNL